MAAQIWATFANPTIKAISTYAGTGGATTSGPANPVCNADGINVIAAIFSTKGTTVTASVSDVIVMALIPEGAVIVAGSLVGKSGATSTTIKVGLGVAGLPASAAGAANDGVLLAATALSSTRSVAQFGVAGGLPYKVAAIAAATYPKVYPLVCTVAGSVTVSLCFSVNLIYTTANTGVL